MNQRPPGYGPGELPLLYLALIPGLPRYAPALRVWLTGIFRAAQQPTGMISTKGPFVSPDRRFLSDL